MSSISKDQYNSIKGQARNSRPYADYISKNAKLFLTYPVMKSAIQSGRLEILAEIGNSRDMYETGLKTILVKSLEFLQDLHLMKNKEDSGALAAYLEGHLAGVVDVYTQATGMNQFHVAGLEIANKLHRKIAKDSTLILGIDRKLEQVTGHEAMGVLEKYRDRIFEETA